jgi:hypothetical protein
MRAIAVIRDGVVSSPEGVLISGPDAPRETRAVAVREPKPALVIAMDPVDEIAALLGRVINIAQQLDATDQRRVRDLSHATIAALNASTYLEESDQRRFEAAIRNTK